MEEEKNVSLKKRISKKTIIIITIVSIILVVIIIGTIALFAIINDKSYELEEVNDFIYFRLYQQDKYGVIDNNGNIIIEPRYEMITIPNPGKDLFICYTKNDVEKNEYETIVYNSKNEKILTEYGNTILPLMYEDALAEVPYEKSVLMYKENNKYGIINFEGEKITEAIYDEIKSLLYREGCLIVKKDNKYGIINIKGKKVIDISYDSISADGYYDKETKYQKAGFIIGIKENENYKYGYADYNGNKILNVEYSEVNRITEISREEGIYITALKNGKNLLYKNNKQLLSEFSKINYDMTNEFFIVEKYSKQGIVDKKAQMILKAEYDNIKIVGNKVNAERNGTLYEFDNDGNNKKEKSNIANHSKVEGTKYIITMNEEGIYGLIDDDSNVVLPSQYSYIEYTFDNYFIVANNEKVNLIDAKENRIVIENYNIIQKLKDKNIIEAIVLEPYTIDLYNEKLEKVTSMQNSNLEVKDDYIILSSNTQRKYFNNSGKEIPNTVVFNLDLYTFSNEEGKWGFKDINNNVIIQPVYDNATELNKYGFAGIQKEGKWGIIDRKGNIIVEPIYKIEFGEPNFIGKYYEVNLGYGLVYYTDNILE